jgi:hypothetical protein
MACLLSPEKRRLKIHKIDTSGKQIVGALPKFWPVGAEAVHEEHDVSSEPFTERRAHIHPGSRS